MAEPDPCIKLDIGSHLCWSCAGWRWIYCKRLEVIIVIHILCLYMYVSVCAGVCVCTYMSVSVCVCVCVCTYMSVFFWVYLLFHLMHQTHCPQLYVCMYTYCRSLHILLHVHSTYYICTYTYICMQCYLCTYMKHDCGAYYSCTSVSIMTHLIVNVGVLYIIFVSMLCSFDWKSTQNT